MENASRAIVMAGGVFLAMLLLSLIAFAWNRYAEYQTSQDSITDVENIAKFNEQFTNYQRDDVQGYELISLSNKVADYNNRYAASISSGTGTGTYSEVSLYIYMYDSGGTSEGEENVLKLTKNGSDVYLFKKGSSIITVFEQSLKKTLTSNVFSDIYDKATNIESTYFGDASSATRVAKAIDEIFYFKSRGKARDDLADTVKYLKENKKMDNDAIEKYGMQKYNSCISVNSAKISDTSKLYATSSSSSLYYNAMTYYEYMMFKTMVFKCTSVTYDQETQRVKTMTFKCTGNFAD